jgi:hypothetical protein
MSHVAHVRWHNENDLLPWTPRSPCTSEAFSMLAFFMHARLSGSLRWLKKPVPMTNSLFCFPASFYRTRHATGTDQGVSGLSTSLWRYAGHITKDACHPSDQQRKRHEKAESSRRQPDRGQAAAVRLSSVMFCRCVLVCAGFLLAQVHDEAPVGFNTPFRQGARTASCTGAIHDVSLRLIAKISSRPVHSLCQW